MATMRVAARPEAEPMTVAQISNPFGDFEGCPARDSQTGSWPSRFRGHDELRKPFGMRPMIETFPLERSAEAYARMISGETVSCCPDDVKSLCQYGCQRSSRPLNMGAYAT